MQHAKPFILLPAASHNAHSPQTYGLNQSYIDAIVRAGGNPIIVVRPDEDAQNKLLQFVDGIFLAGGHDVDPKEYGEERKAYTCDIDQDRDHVELALVRRAQERNIPIFGVCRGLQVMNIALGGSLYQDVFMEMPGAITHDLHTDTTGKLLPRSMLGHEIVLEEDSRLAAIVGMEKFEVNSLHHQGIKKLGTGLSVAGTAPDGLVEAIEMPDHPFCVGVQWHPEELANDTSTKLFAAFIDACKTAKSVPLIKTEFDAVTQSS